MVDASGNPCEFAYKSFDPLQEDRGRGPHVHEQHAVSKIFGEGDVSRVDDCAWCPIKVQQVAQGDRDRRVGLEVLRLKEDDALPQYTYCGPNGFLQSRRPVSRNETEHRGSLTQEPY